MSKYKYYTRNARYRVSRSVHLGAQRAARGGSQETKRTPRSPNCKVHEQKGRKCAKCGTMLLRPEEYIIDWINQDLRVLCNECNPNRS